LKFVQQRLTPTRENAYRPPVLGRTSLVLFLALALAVEGFLVASLAAHETDGAFMTATILNALPAPFAIALLSGISANGILIAIAAILLLAVAVAFVMHIDIQARDMLLGGVVVAGVALTLVAANTHFLASGTPAASIEAGDKALVVEE